MSQPYYIASRVFTSKYTEVVVHFSVMFPECNQKS